MANALYYFMLNHGPYILAAIPFVAVSAFAFIATR